MLWKDGRCQYEGPWSKRAAECRGLLQPRATPNQLLKVTTRQQSKTPILWHSIGVATAPERTHRSHFGEYFAVLAPKPPRLNR